MMKVVKTAAYKTGKVRVKLSPPTSYRSKALTVAPPTVLEHRRGKLQHSMDLLTLNKPGVFQQSLINKGS